MNILEILLIEALLIINFIVLFFLFHKRLIVYETRLTSIHKRIDNIFTMDKPSENEATKVDNNIVDLDENNSYDIPDNVKFAVEGGDSNVPPEYEQATN